jgi:hypothetical protein
VLLKKISPSNYKIDKLYDINLDANNLEIESD